MNLMASAAPAALAAPGIVVTIGDSMGARRREYEDKFASIVTRLQSLADDQVRRKAVVEQRWLEDLRNFHGRYEEGTDRALRDAKRSRAFVKVTRKKTNAWIGRIQELLFPTDDRNWGIKPTPVPTLTKEATEAANTAEAAAAAASQQMPADPSADPNGEQAMAAMQTAQAGNDAAQRANELQGQIAEAKKRADAMQEEMDDQLTECQWPAQARDAIHDFVKLGTAIVKGPITGERVRGAWKMDPETGKHVYDRQPDPAPIYRRVDPWSYFPDMSAMSDQEKEFEFERHLWTKTDLRRGVRESGFDPDAVRDIIGDNSTGDITGSVAANLQSLVQLRAITGETDTITGRYVGWEYHGPLECDEIVAMLRVLAARMPDGSAEQMAAFMEADQVETENDPLEERRVIVHFCNGRVLKMASEYVLDSGESLYSTAPFEPGESSLFGYGIPNIMGDSQRAINGGWRMTMDNGGLSSGPQIVIDKDKVEPEDGSWALAPRKVWRRKTSQGVSNQPAFEQFVIANNTTSLIEIVREARQHADDETALPQVSEGEIPDGAAQTATAWKLANAGSNVTFRRVVKSWDDGITEPSMRRLFDWNMQFNDREDIKGDCSIDARGVSVLLVKEMQSQILMAIASNWTVHQAIAPMLKVYDVLVATLKSFGIAPDDVLVTKDEYAKILKQMQEQAAQEAQQGAEDPANAPAVIAAKTNLQKAQLESQTSLQIAQLQRDTEMFKLAEAKNMSMDKLRAMLVQTKMGIDSKERIFAGETGVEMQMSREAHARGEQPAGSGGYISAGEKPESVPA